MADYAQVPHKATLDIRPFKAHVGDDKLKHFRALLELSPIGPAVFENTSNGRTYGIEREWLLNAKMTWLNDFDWRKHEDRINSFPNFKAVVKDGDGNTIDVHFLALFSQKDDAIPIALFHSWPGSACDFMDMLDILRSTYSPKDLPYHVIVPCLPGYGYSSGPPLDKEYDVGLVADAMNNLMVGLGFGSGYLAHGGDLGSFVSRILALKYDACKGLHVNLMTMPPEAWADDTKMTDEQIQTLQRAAEFIDTSMGFALEQGTRPATVGLVLSASPIALLCWIGEKLLEGTDKELPLDKILETVTLYWLTDTAPRTFYHNRQFLNRGDEQPRMARISVLTQKEPLKVPFIKKPTGYSLFAHEIVTVPKSWAELTCNLVSFNQHEHGGHLAALEKPGELLADIEDYVKKAWKSA